MYNCSVVIEDVQDLPPLITLTEFLVFNRFRDLLVKQLEYRITYSVALFFLGWAAQHDGACWRILSEKCITEITESVTQVLTDIISGEISTSSFKDIQFEHMHSILRTVQKKNHHYMRWKLLTYFMEEKYEVDITSTEEVFQLMEGFLKAKDKLLYLQMSIPPRQRQQEQKQQKPSSQKRKKPQSKEEEEAKKYDYLIKDHVKVVTSAPDHIPLVDMEGSDETDTKKQLLLSLGCTPKYADILSQHTPMMWDFIINDVIANELVHHFTQHRDEILKQHPSVIYQILQFDTLQVESEDVVVDFLIEWYKNFKEANKQQEEDEEKLEMAEESFKKRSILNADAKRLFSCVRYYFISLPCIHKILHTPDLPDLLNSITPNLLRNILEFKVSGLENKLNASKAVKAVPRVVSEWSEIKPLKKSRKIKVQETIVQDSSSDDEDDEDSEQVEENSTSNYSIEVTKKEVTGLLLRLLAKTSFTTQEIKDLMNN
jgi:hypothetical protein